MDILLPPPTPVTDQDLYRMIGAQSIRILVLEQQLAQTQQIIVAHQCPEPLATLPPSPPAPPATVHFKDLPPDPAPGSSSALPSRSKFPDPEYP
jgi:hypothetical protein